MTADPIVKTVRVSLPVDDAFRLFTEGIARWWPLGKHSVSAGQGKPAKSLSLEGRIGGSLAEVAHDDTRHIWGHVEEWVPGKAFTVTWHPGTSPDEPTRVRVTFEPDGSGCVVTLTHSGWDVLGKAAATKRDHYDQGWIGVLECYAGAI